MPSEILSRLPDDLPTGVFMRGEFHTEARAAFDVIDPARGARLAAVSVATPHDAERALRDALGALPTLAALPAAVRQRNLAALADAMDASADALARVVAAETGKPRREAEGEVRYATSFVRYYATEPLPQAPRGEDAPDAIEVRYAPVGVALAITPWNFPLAMITRKFAPAYATGCPLILKPAEATPLSALAFAALIRDVALPPAALAVLPCPRSDAARLTEPLLASHDVRKLSFTGSTAVGTQLAAACAGTMKRVSLELGGNAPLLVFADADIEATVDAAMVAKFRNGGQSCVAAQRFLVDASVAERFEAALVASMRALRVGVEGPGEGELTETDVGPMIEESGVARMRALAEDAVACGGRLVLGGDAHPAGERFARPTLVAGVTDEMRVWREEAFGPLVSLRTFPAGDDAEAIRLANDTHAGLVAYAFTADEARRARLTDPVTGLRAGMIGLGTGMVSDARAPFGGVGMSGVGREGGALGYLPWLEPRYVRRE